MPAPDAVTAALDDLDLALTSLKFNHPDCGRVQQLARARTQHAAMVKALEAADMLRDELVYAINGAMQSSAANSVAAYRAARTQVTP